MATRRRSIWHGSTRPDDTQRVTVEPYGVVATNDRWLQNVIIIDEDGTDSAQLTTRSGIFTLFRVPADYVTNPKLRITWTASKTSGAAVFDADYRAIGGDDTESLDQSGTQESVSVTDTAPSGAHNKMQATVDLTAANLAADDLVEAWIGCDGTDAADTLAGARVIFDIEFVYDDA